MALQLSVWTPAARGLLIAPCSALRPRRMQPPLGSLSLTARPPLTHLSLATASSRSLHAASSSVRLHGRHRHDKFTPHDEAEQASPAGSSASPSLSPLPSPSAFFSHLPSYIRRARALLSHYMLGAKLMWKHTKESRQIKKRVALSPASLTWPEHQLLRRAHSDLTVGVPFVLLFMVPVIGNVAPLLAILAPRFVPGSVWTPEQVGEIVRADARATVRLLGSLGGEVYGFHPAACGLERLRDLLRRVERGEARVDNLLTLRPLAPLFTSLTPHPQLYPRSHLLLLNQSLLHGSTGFARLLLPKRALVARLESWRRDVWEDDQLLRAYGVEKLTPAQLAHALYFRGVYRYPRAMSVALSAQHAADLASVNGNNKQPEQKQPPGAPEGSSQAAKSSLPAPQPTVTDAIVSDWRATLAQWLELHQALQAEADAREAEEKKRKNEEKSAATGNASAGSAVKHVKVSDSNLSPPRLSFPLSFLLHAPAMSRVSNSGLMGHMPPNASPASSSSPPQSGSSATEPRFGESAASDGPARSGLHPRPAEHTQAIQDAAAVQTDQQKGA